MDSRRNASLEPSEPTEETSLRAGLRALGKTPLFVFGVGLYRAWIELAIISPVGGFSAVDTLGRNLYDIAAVIVWILAALLARKIAPLFKHKSLIGATIVCMTVGTLLILTDYYFPGSGTYLVYSGLILSGAGCGLLVLLWSEYFGCLNPMRVALYYSGSLVLGALVVLVFKGFNDLYLSIAVTLLPVLSVISVIRSFNDLPQEDRPRGTWGKFSFPWKPVLLMAVYAFAYGLCEHMMYNVSSGPHSSLGVVLVSIIIFIGVLFFSDKFNFSIAYRFALPSMVCGLLLISLAFPGNENLSTIFILMSYTAFSIMIMLILSNLSYRLGIGAVWLFGIERAVRQLMMFSGRAVNDFLIVSDLAGSVQTAVITALVIVMIIVALFILLSEKELITKWGISFLHPADDGEISIERNRLFDRCGEVSARYKLSDREGEVLYLLAEKKSISTIEHQLYIANGTVKAHIRHIYEKCGIHSRKELYQLLGIDGA